MIFTLNSSTNKIQNIFDLIFYAKERKCKNGKILSKKQQISFDNALLSMIKHSNRLAFDDTIKGTIESGFRANFLVLSKPLTEIEKGNINDIISMVYMEGERLK